MSDLLALDLQIQDFIQTNRLCKQHYDWNMLVNRRFVESCHGAQTLFSYQTGGVTEFASADHLLLPDGDFLRITLYIPRIPSLTEFRFDCLRMLLAATHTGLVVDTRDPKAITVTMTTRHLGIIPIVFVIREGSGIRYPFLI